MKEPEFLKTILDLFLEQESPENKKKAEDIFEKLEKYLELLYKDEDEQEIYFEDLTAFEIDDFLEFYLEDNFSEFASLKKRARWIFRRLYKWAKKNKKLSDEQREEWGEVLES